MKASHLLISCNIHVRQLGATAPKGSIGNSIELLAPRRHRLLGLSVSWTSDISVPASLSVRWEYVGTDTRLDVDDKNPDNVPSSVNDTSNWLFTQLYSDLTAMFTTNLEPGDAVVILVVHRAKNTHAPSVIDHPECVWQLPLQGATPCVPQPVPSGDQLNKLQANARALSSTPSTRIFYTCFSLLWF